MGIRIETLQNLPQEICNTAGTRKHILSIAFMISALASSGVSALASQNDDKALADALCTEDSEKVIDILSSAGGACQARELAKAAKALHFRLRPR